MIIKKALPIGTILGVGFFNMLNASADTTSDLNDAKTLQQYYQNVYNSVAALTPSSASSAVASAQASVNTNSDLLGRLPRVKDTTYTNKINVSSTWVTYYDRYLNADSLTDKNSAKRMLSTIAENEASNNKFNGTGLDNKTKYSIASLSMDQKKALNEYFVGLINSLHAQMGTNQTVYYNTTTMAFADSIAKGYQSANVVATNGHDLNIINRVAGQYNLVQNSNFNQYENITQAYVTSIKSPTFTEYQLYKMVYDSALNFTIYDVYSNFGHLKSLTTSPTMGLAYSTVVDTDGWVHIQMHVESVPTSNQMRNPSQYESTYGITASATVKPNPAQASAQVAYNSGSASLSSAQRALSSAASSLDYMLSMAASSLANATKALSSAQSAYDAYQSQSSQSSQAASIAASQSASIAASQSASIAASQSAAQSSGANDDLLDEPITVKLLIKARLFIDNS